MHCRKNLEIKKKFHSHGKAKALFWGKSSFLLSKRLVPVPRGPLVGNKKFPAAGSRTCGSV
jgi:hypothetical protein